MINTPTLSHKDAVVVLHAVKSELERRNKGAAVAIVDEHGELLAFVRTDGCRLPSIIIAMNKMDLYGTNPDRIKPQLNEHGVMVEDWGGSIGCIPVSATTGRLSTPIW